jgi:hypothetical protein
MEGRPKWIVRWSLSLSETLSRKKVCAIMYSGSARESSSEGGGVEEEEMTCSLPQSGEINIHLDHRLGQVLLVPDEMVNVVQIEHQLHGVPDGPHQMERLSREGDRKSKRGGGGGVLAPAPLPRWQISPAAETNQILSPSSLPEEPPL